MKNKYSHNNPAVLRKIISGSILIALTGLCHSQSSFQSVVTEISANNSGMKAAAFHRDAGISASKEGLMPSNPEIEAGILSGNSNPSIPRRDYSVTQSIEFPTVYVHKNRMAETSSKLSQLEYDLQRREFELLIRHTCSELVFQNRLIATYEEKASQAKLLSESIERRFTLGDATIIERNKARAYLLGINSELASHRLEQQSLIFRLTALNNGNTPDLTGLDYPLYTLPGDFEDWYKAVRAQHPSLNRAMMESTISDQNIQLTKAATMPQLSAGYMSESAGGESFRGLTIGMTVPLWENRNRVNSARLESLAAKERQAEIAEQTYSELMTTYNNALILHRVIKDYSDARDEIFNTSHLDKALEAREISFIEYLLEQEYYQDLLINLSTVERDLNLSISELTVWSQISE